MSIEVLKKDKYSTARMEAFATKGSGRGNTKWMCCRSGLMPFLLSRIKDLPKE